MKKITHINYKCSQCQTFYGTREDAIQSNEHAQFMVAYVNYTYSFRNPFRFVLNSISQSITQLIKL